jgi:ribonuclease HI
MSETKARHPGRHIIIHTDGACIGNPGPGGWAAILQAMDGETEIKRKPISGFEPVTTNNKMELTAAIQALRAIQSKNPVFIRSDSQYLIKGVTQWLAGWKANGWRKADKKPVENRDLWETLDALVAELSVTWEWIRGHNGDLLNEEVDRLANAEARKAMSA